MLSVACVCMVDAGFKLPPLKLKFRESIAVVVAATAFQLPLPAPFFHPQIALATVNQLADVGLKEFLVKDGRQFLRLAIPVGELSELILIGSSHNLQADHQTFDYARC